MARLPGGPRAAVAAGAVAVLAVIVVIIVALSGGDSDEAAPETTTTTTTSTTTTTTTTTLPLGPFAPLTGEDISDRPELLEAPALVVKIANNSPAVDQSRAALVGIEAADIVIEERIEARATRFFAIFHSELPEVVGSVRSGRTTDVALLPAFGNPILVYSGANSGVQGQLNAVARNDEVVLVVDDGRGVNLYRDRDFRAPANLFADLAFVRDEFGDEAGAPPPFLTFRRPDSPARTPGAVGLGVTVTGADDVAFVYVPGEGYVRVQNGEVHVTREGTPLTADNLMILETRYEPSEIYPDSVDAITVAWGPAIVLYEGEMWQGTWERPDRSSPYRIVGADGEEILLDPGRTWISLAPPDTYELDVDPEIVELARGAGG